MSRSSVASVSFYISGDEDIRAEACGTTTNKSLFSDGVPVANGLYDAHYGAPELDWKCLTCFHNKLNCPGHDGKADVNYAVRSALFIKEIPKWLRIACWVCSEPVIKRDLPPGIPAANRLDEFNKLVRTGTERHRLCAHCGADHPWITKDPHNNNEVIAEWYTKGQKAKPERRRMVLHNEIADILGRISDAFVLRMGKQLNSHPRKLILKTIKIPSNVIRPEIRKIGGSRSTMNDVTAHLKNLIELNSQIPKEIPKQPDNDLMNKLILIDLTFYEMLVGTSSSSTGVKLVTNINKTASPIAARLPKKAGRFRANLMGRRVVNVARSVATGNKAIRPDQIGVPLKICRNLYMPEVVRGKYNRDKLTMCFINGPHKYPGCTKIRRADTGFEHYVENMSKDYVLQDGDMVYRHVMDGDRGALNREPALLYSSIIVLSIKVTQGLTLQVNSIICGLLNKRQC